MIEKMKFLSITGPKADIDRFTGEYLTKYEIHLENALSELKTVSNLRPFLESNPYKAELQTAAELLERFQDCMADCKPQEVSLADALTTVQTLNLKVNHLAAAKQALEKQMDTLLVSRNNIIPFTDLNYDVSSILHFQYIRFRFGRIPHNFFDKFMSYVYDGIDAIIHKCQEDADYVWIVYFVPESRSDKIDAIFASMHFERFFLPDEYEGTPVEASHLLEEKINKLKKQINDVEEQIRTAVSSGKEALAGSYHRLTSFATNFDIRKQAACINQEGHTFYILCGWMTEANARAFRKDLEDEADTFCFIEDDHNNIFSKPPTKLNNPGLFKPFEMFIQMYGLPAYDEIDPTILTGLLYSLLFGFMFGDVGQGLCLLVGGFLLYRAKKLSLAAIISCCGFFSAVFGFLFGSVFGFENIIDSVWLRPKEAMTQLPFIGSLNTVFVVAVALGMGIVLITMVLNVINSLQAHDAKKALFDTNGIAGIVFYGAVAVTIFLYMSGHALPAAVVLVIMFLLPMLVIFFQEPLTALAEKKSEAMPKQKGMFFVQGFFEMFEVLLSYFSNTLSFVRIGAFAVSHAAMMEVVLMLAGAETGTPNWVVVVLGNLLVCGMEGLIVGIQVLRLEYYELFSRFYRGTGRAFRPHGKGDLKQDRKH